MAQSPPNSSGTAPGALTALGNEAAAADLLAREQLDTLFRSPLAAVINVVNAAIVAVAVTPVLTTGLLVAWVGAMIAVVGARVVLRQCYWTYGNALRQQSWLTLNAWGAGTTGALWGASALVIPWVNDPTYDMLMGVTTAGMCGGALVVLHVHLRSFAAYVIPCAIPIAIAFLARGDTTHIAVGVMALVYAAVLLASARSFAAAFRETVGLRNKLARANIELESRVEQRTVELKDSEHLIRLLADNLPAFIGYVDADERYRFVNRAGQRWYTCPSAEIIGRQVSEILPPGTYARVKPLMTKVLSGSPVRAEFQGKYPDGLERWIDLLYVPDIDDRGGVRGFFALASDISDRKNIEERLIQTQRMEAVGRLTAGVAHDFNNLLGVVIGNLDLLRPMLDEQSEEHDLAHQALTAAERGAVLTHQLLAFGRQQALRPRPVDVNVLLADLLRLLERTLGESIAVTLRRAEHLWLCRVDPAQLESAIVNLAINARDAMPNGGHLTLATANDSMSFDRAPGAQPVDYVHISVADDGMGMPADVVARAFEPFFTTKDVGMGTGLGLSMVHGFVNQSGGQVRIDSAPGRGTVVHLYLPRASDKADETTPSPVRMASERGGAGRGERVLVVEDNGELRRVAVTMLRQLGYVPIEAGDAHAALEALRKDSGIAVLFTDIVLPGGINGFDLARAALREHPRLGVIYASGYTDRAPAAEAGVPPDVDILTKPYRIAELARLLQQACAGRANPS